MVVQGYCTATQKKGAQEKIESKEAVTINCEKQDSTSESKEHHGQSCVSRAVDAFGPGEAYKQIRGEVDNVENKQIRTALLEQFVEKVHLDQILISFTTIYL